MPARNALKRYAENGYYHVYNRGVAKSEIFPQEQDYSVFLYYLKEYLSPPKKLSPEEIQSMRAPHLLKNYYQEIELLSFCLMPNHFHLLIKQKNERTIESFMKSLTVRYTSYFNKNHQRQGHLFQGVYKGKLVENTEYLWWLSRYIHRNPLEILPSNQTLTDYPYSSYPAYLGKQNLAWVSINEISNQIKNYSSFVESKEEKSPENASEFTLEERETP